MDARWLDAGGARILYLHGVPSASFDWLPLLERTGGGAPDLPGFGHSAKPAEFDYSIGGYDRWLEAFVAQAELERFSLVVHDWGGVGLALAQRFPERIDRLALCCTSAKVDGEVYLERAAKVRAGGTASVVDDVVPRWFTPAFRRAAPHTVDRALAMLTATPDEGYAGCCEAIAALDEVVRHGDGARHVLLAGLPGDGDDLAGLDVGAEAAAVVPGLRVGDGTGGLGMRRGGRRDRQPQRGEPEGEAEDDSGARINGAG